MKGLGRSWSLVSQVETSQRIAAGMLAAALVISLTGSWYLLGVTQPRLARTIDMTRQARLVYEGMLDREASVLGWLATGDDDFLDDTPSDASDADARALVQSLTAEPELAPAVTQMLVQRERWIQWSTAVLAQAPTEQDRLDGKVSADLIAGKEVFDAYRAAQLAATDRIVDLRDASLEAQRRAMVAMMATDAGLLVVALVLVHVRGRAVTRRITGPVRTVLAGIDTLRSGAGGFDVTRSGLQEIDVIAGELTKLAGEVQAAQEQAAARESRLTSLTDHLHLLLTLSRGVAGSTSLHLTAQAVVDAGRQLLGGATTLWLPDPDADGALRAAAVSATASETPALTGEVPRAVRVCSADLRRETHDGVTAYPLVLTGQLVGVISVETARISPEAGEVLDALLSTAAAALASTRAHSSTRREADTDPLTGLLNRRRMDLDLMSEVTRSVRFERPLSVLMLDLDHFKRVNDTFGHAAGDLVLREVASRIATQMRTTDTAYRFGGEEVAVVLRETDAEQALLVAERLRAAIAAARVPAVDCGISASIGQATWSPSMLGAADLLGAADAALFEAKRAGRDRVVSASG